MKRIILVLCLCLIGCGSTSKYFNGKVARTSELKGNRKDTWLAEYYPDGQLKKEEHTTERLPIIKLPELKLDKLDLNKDD